MKKLMGALCVLVLAAASCRAASSRDGLTLDFSRAAILSAKPLATATSVEYWDYVPSDPGQHPVLIEPLDKLGTKVRVTWTAPHRPSPVEVLVFVRVSFLTQDIPSETKIVLTWTPIGWVTMKIEGRVE